MKKILLIGSVIFGTILTSCSKDDLNPKGSDSKTKMAELTINVSGDFTLGKNSTAVDSLTKDSDSYYVVVTPLRVEDNKTSAGYVGYFTSKDNIHLTLAQRSYAIYVTTYRSMGDKIDWKRVNSTLQENKFVAISQLTEASLTFADQKIARRYGSKSVKLVSDSTVSVGGKQYVYGINVNMEKPLEGSVQLSCESPAFSYVVSSADSTKAISQIYSFGENRADTAKTLKVSLTHYDASGRVTETKMRELSLSPNHVKNIKYQPLGAELTYKFVVEDAVITGKPKVEYDEDLYNNHEYVDMGVTDSYGNTVYFSKMNLGASSPEGFGDYYAWGETAPKANYAKDWSTYFDTDDGENFKKYSVKDGLTELERCDDAASVNWGGEWRMPTEAELMQLKDNCTWTWTTINGNNGYEVTADNGNSIFMPATGFKYDTGIAKKNIKGVYWSSTLNIYSKHAKRLWLMKEIENATYEPTPIGIAQDSRYYGECIRPVYTRLTE